MVTFTDAGMRTWMDISWGPPFNSLQHVSSMSCILYKDRVRGVRKILKNIYRSVFLLSINSASVDKQ